MTIEKTAGLSFKEAQAEALAEFEAATSDSEGDATPSAEEASVDDVEQSAVEKPEEKGLFSPLEDEENEDEQPNEDSFTLEVDGQRLSADELRQGYMRQADYTKKTQELSEEKAELQKAKTLWEALQDDPAGTVRQLWQRVQGGENPVDAKPKQNGTTQEDIDAIVERKIQERLQSDPRLQEIEAKNAMSRINSAFAEIEEQHDVTLNDEDRQLVLRRALDEGTANLRMVFNDMMWEVEQKLKEKENAKQTSTAHGRRFDPSEDEVPVPEKFSSFKDAWKATQREMGVDDLVEDIPRTVVANL